MRPMTSPARLTPRFTFSASVDQLVLIACLFWAFSANRLFLGAALKQHGDVPVAGFALALVVMLVALHYLLIAPFAYRHTVKPLLTLLLFGAAVATHYMRSYGVVLDTSMMTNVWRTDPAEARELLSWGLATRLLLYAALPAALLWRVQDGAPSRGHAPPPSSSAAWCWPWSPSPPRCCRCSNRSRR